MNIYLIIIISILGFILFTLLIIRFIIYLHNRNLNISGDRPPDFKDDKKKNIVSTYEYVLDLSFIFNKYNISFTFYTDHTIIISMFVYDSKNNLIATNLYNNNIWKTVSDGYEIEYDPNLIKDVQSGKCTLDNFVAYNKDYIVVTGRVPVPIIGEIKVKVNKKN
jgi:hypothetical protein